MLRKEKSIKSISPMDSARNGFETLVKMDRTDSGKLNMPSPQGSFQRTQSFIKQILSMKTDLNQLFPTETKTSNTSPAVDSDLQCSSSRSYGVYRKKNNKSVKLAPLTPDNYSNSSSNDVTPSSSKRISMEDNHVSFESPADPARLWQTSIYSPMNEFSSSSSSSSSSTSMANTLQIGSPMARATAATARMLHFAEHDDLVSMNDDCSVGAVQSEEDYHHIHKLSLDAPLHPAGSIGSHKQQKQRSRRKCISLDYDDYGGIPSSTSTSLAAVLRSPLPSTLKSMSTETHDLHYHPQFLPLTKSNLPKTHAVVPSSISESTDLYDDLDQHALFPANIRTKSFNGAGLGASMDLQEEEEEEEMLAAFKSKDKKTSFDSVQPSIGSSNPRHFFSQQSSNDTLLNNPVIAAMMRDRASPNQQASFSSPSSSSMTTNCPSKASSIKSEASDVSIPSSFSTKQPKKKQQPQSQPPYFLVKQQSPPPPQASAALQTTPQTPQCVVLDDLEGDDDFVDLDASPEDTEVERFLASYCSGKDNSSKTAIEALEAESSDSSHPHNHPHQQQEVVMKNVKTRKGTGIPAKKLLAMTNFDDEEDDEDEDAYHANNHTENTDELEDDFDDTISERTYRSVSSATQPHNPHHTSSNQHSMAYHPNNKGPYKGYDYDDEEGEEDDDNYALYSRSMDTTVDAYHFADNHQSCDLVFVHSK